MKLGLELHRPKIVSTVKYKVDAHKLISVIDNPNKEVSPGPEILYSEESNPNSEMLGLLFEQIISKHSILYCSGITMFYSVMTLVNPK